MALEGDRFFGFDLIQRKTLARLLSESTELLASLPTVDPEDGETIWNDNGVLKVASTV